MEEEKSTNEQGEEPEAVNHEILSDALLQQIQSTIGDLQQDFAQKIKSNENQKQAFEKLYAEMKLYKDNFLQVATKPLVQDLILLYDNTRRQHQHAQHEEAKACLENTVEEIEEVLYRRDVELIPRTYEKRERHVHRAVKLVATLEQTDHDKIVEIVRDGFTWNDKVLRPQEVIIYKYSEQTNG